MATLRKVVEPVPNPELSHFVVSLCRRLCRSNDFQIDKVNDKVGDKVPEISVLPSDVRSHLPLPSSISQGGIGVPVLVNP